MSYPFDQIRNYYEDIRFDIYEISRGRKYNWLNPYSDKIDWLQLFTPIEEQTWMILRSFGKCPLYPQYPVRKYFVDFGNPVVKVALECDGKQWHTDKAKDQERDTALLEAGWIVYRISGKDCMKPNDKFEELRDYNEYNEDEKWHILKDFYSNTVYGLVKSISIFHFGCTEFMYHENEIDLAYICLNNRISINDDMLEEVYDRLKNNQVKDNDHRTKALEIYKYGRNRYVP